MTGAGFALGVPEQVALLPDSVPLYMTCDRTGYSLGPSILRGSPVQNKCKMLVQFAVWLARQS